MWGWLLQDPLLRSCTLSVASEEAAAELVAQLQAARQRLAAAVQVRATAAGGRHALAGTTCQAHTPKSCLLLP